MRAARVVLIIVAIALVGAIAWVVFSPQIEEAGRSTVSVTDEAEIVARVIAFAADPYLDDYGTTRVTGWVENIGEQEIAVTRVEVQLVREDGEKEELVRIEVRDIEPGTRKSYEANAGTLDGPRRAEISVPELEVYSE